MTAAAPDTGRRGSLWRHRDFMKLWSAQSISQLGTQVTFLALPLVAISVLQVSAFEVALLGTVEFLPFILISIPAGVWVDRLRRRPILIIGDVGRAVALLSIPIAHLAGVLTIWQLYAVGFANGVLTVFFDVAYQSYLPALVERDRLVEGNAKLDTSRSGAQLVGPGLAGVIIGRLTAPIAILVDSISYFVSAALVFWIRKAEPAPEPQLEGERPSMRREAVEGLRYVLTHRYLRNIAACTGSSNFFSNVTFSILLVYAVRELGMTEITLGLIFSLGSVGFLLGALIASRIADRLGVGRTILAAAMLFGSAELLIPIAPRGLAFPFLVASVFLGGLGGVIYNINQVSLRQAITPERMQGRMNATMRFIVWGTIPLGSLTGGAIGTIFGLPAAIWAGAIGNLFTWIPIALSPVPTIVRMPESAAEEAASLNADAPSRGVPPFAPVPDAAGSDPKPEARP
ncbi:MAG: MFS transporter [Candidatus Limnocylindria bacterium]